MKTRMTFKQYVLSEEYISQQALKIAAELLHTVINKLKLVDDKEVEEKVLDTGKEVTHKYVKMADGSLVVRIFKALGKMFARIEAPGGEKFTYEAA